MYRCQKSQTNFGNRVMTAPPNSHKQLKRPRQLRQNYEFVYASYCVIVPQVTITYSMIVFISIGDYGLRSTAHQTQKFEFCYLCSFYQKFWVSIQVSAAQVKGLTLNVLHKCCILRKKITQIVDIFAGLDCTFSTPSLRTLENLYPNHVMPAHQIV